jgi:hypothetical protein
MARGATARLVLVSLPFLASCTNVPGPPETQTAESPFVTDVRAVLARVPGILEMNHKTFAVGDGTIRGFGAGEAYPQIWLRDSAWIVPAAAAYYDADSLVSWLDLHLSVALKSGRLRDWVAAGPADKFREWAPRVEAKGPLSMDTNTNESDQEPSAALAYCRIVDALRGQAAVTGPAHAARVARLVKAMEALVRDRTDAKSGLIWSGLTADWGDVSPLYPDQRAIYFDARTPRTVSLYSNVMAYAAFDCLASLTSNQAEADSLRTRAERLRDRIRSAMWMKDLGYFRIRVPLDSVPDPFKDDVRFALGGNALAALYGVAGDDEAKSIFDSAERLRGESHASTISANLDPPYPAGVFQHPAMREPSQYQNGGEWDWFGAALVEAEFRRGYSAQASAHLGQIATRILKAGPGLHEWYARDGSPRGSAAYSASAASLYGAIVSGWLGVTNSAEGLQIALRTSETFSPIELPQRASSARIRLSQKVATDAIEVEVESSARVREVCSLLPRGRTGADPTSARRIGADTMHCADVSARSSPIRLRFPLLP